ncbi:MAG: GAF and ANTAR domain-containing protein [Jatrophihabitantaceae bacterium]
MEEPSGISPGDSDDRGVRSSLAGICALLLEQVPVAAASVVVMTAAGHRGTAYASSDWAAKIEEVGFLLGEGPCDDAFRNGGPVLVSDLGRPFHSSYRRWPAYTAVLVGLGVRAVCAFPLQFGAVAVGTLALYALEPTQLSDRQLSSVLGLADSAALSLLDAVTGGDPGDGLARPLDGSMYRSEVYQATGMISEQLHIPVADAMSRLRGHAYASNRPLADIARDVVTRRLRLQDDNGEATQGGRCHGHD